MRARGESPDSATPAARAGRALDAPGRGALHGGRRDLARKGLGPRLLELLPEDEFQLFGIGDAAQPRELRGQLQILGDEALIFAIEQEADLAQRVDVALVA